MSQLQDIADNQSPDGLTALAGLGPAPALNAARDKFGAGKRAGGAAQGQAAPVASAAALAAARYWKEQQEDESEQGKIITLNRVIMSRCIDRMRAGLETE